MSDDQGQSAPVEDGDESAGILVDRVASIHCAKCGCEIDTSELHPFVHVQCPDCEHVEVVPARLGSFLLLKLLGTGGMGGVYYAKDETLGRHVAIKVMLESLGNNTEFVENFRREAQAAAQLNHPHIAQIYSFGQEKSQPYIVMELVPGKGLDKLIAGGKPPDQAFVMRIGLDIAEGLQAADEIGLVHGDIKPENILLDDKDQAKLVDFGIATFVSQSSQEGVWGTPYYISPEKLRRQKLGAHSDIYSLGATLYHVLSGQPPFEGETPVEVAKARLEHDPQPLHEVREDIDPDVDRIITRMLFSDPKTRYPTYASLISDLRKCLKALQPDANMPSPMKTGKGKKVVIKKKSTGKTGTFTSTSRPKAKAEADTDAAEGEPAVPAKRHTGLKIFLWILLVLCLGGGMTAGILYWRAKKRARVAAAIAAYELAQAQEEGNGYYEDIRSTMFEVVGKADAALQLVDRATNAVFAVTEYRLETPPPAEPEPLPEPEEAVTEPAADTNVADEATATTNAPPEDTGGETGEAVESTDEPGEERPADAEEAAVPEAPPEPDHEIVRVAKEIYEPYYRVLDLASQAESIAEDAEDAHDTLTGTTSPPTAKAQTERLKTLHESIQGLGQDSVAALRSVEEVFRRVDSIRVREEEALAAQRRREQELAAQEAALAAQRREQERLKALVEGELTQVKEARDGCLELVGRYDYEEAARRIKSKIDALQTEDGKDAMSILAERYRHLQQLKAFVIERLTEDPFRWGWGRGSAATDVLGATEFHVKLKDRTVPWAQVDAAQMLKFVRNYLAKRDLGLRVTGEQNLNAAIFIVEHFDEPAAKRAAEAYAEQAVELLPNLEEDVDRLLYRYPDTLPTLP